MSNKQRQAPASRTGWPTHPVAIEEIARTGLSAKEVQDLKEQAKK